jgi:hypothetical protein
MPTARRKELRAQSGAKQPQNKASVKSTKHAIRSRGGSDSDDSKIKFNFTEFVKNDTNENLWIEYYKANPSKVKHYYGSTKDNSTIAAIEKSAKDTGDGFQHLINIIKNGNPMVKDTNYQTPVSDPIYGVAYLTKATTTVNTMDLDYLQENVLMSVGVFTTDTSKIYVMVGICTGFGATMDPPMRGLSGVLSKGVAKIMLDLNKETFITRPLDKMATLFKGKVDDNDKSAEELNIPPIADGLNDAELGMLGQERLKEALDWLQLCKKGELCVDNLCKLKECVGDIAFFHQFVGEVFSPKWPYSGKRISKILEGGSTKTRAVTLGYSKTASRDAKKRVIWKSDKTGAMKVLLKLTSGANVGKMVLRKPATK